MSDQPQRGSYQLFCWNCGELNDGVSCLRCEAPLNHAARSIELEARIKELEKAAREVLRAHGGNRSAASGSAHEVSLVALERVLEGDGPTSMRTAAEAHAERGWRRDLTPRQETVLSILDMGGPATVTESDRWFPLQASQARSIIVGLFRRGLVDCSSMNADGRRVWHITSKGCAALKGGAQDEE